MIIIIIIIIKFYCACNNNFFTVMHSTVLKIEHHENNVIEKNLKGTTKAFNFPHAVYNFCHKKKSFDFGNPWTDQWMQASLDKSIINAVILWCNCRLRCSCRRVVPSLSSGCWEVRQSHRWYFSGARASPDVSGSEPCKICSVVIRRFEVLIFMISVSFSNVFFPVWMFLWYNWFDCCSLAQIFWFLLRLWECLFVPWNEPRSTFISREWAAFREWCFPAWYI